MTLSEALLKWFDISKRKLPFRDINNPYKIWVSEIMLQQTKVNTMIPYYNNWITKFPNISSVAKSTQDEVLKYWEGLGYYSRCRNFYNAAKIVREKFNSIVPNNWSDFRALPGVGDYTSGAVLSIAFNKPYIALDGNVKRVMARLTGKLHMTKYNINLIKSKLYKLMDYKRPGDFNQALMELGACVCLPKSPLCLKCPINSYCKAYKSGNPLDYPKKIIKNKVPTYIYVGGIIKGDNQFLIQKRPSDKMLGGLWEVPNVKITNRKDAYEHFQNYIFEKYGILVSAMNNIGIVNHAYSHFKIQMIVIFCQMNKSQKQLDYNIKNIKWINISEIECYPFHKINHKIFLKLNNAF